MRGRSSGKTGPPVPGLTRVGGGAKKNREASLRGGPTRPTRPTRRRSKGAFDSSTRRLLG